jgi:hypothetical protein
MAVLYRFHMKLSFSVVFVLVQLLSQAAAQELAELRRQALSGVAFRTALFGREVPAGLRSCRGSGRGPAVL